MKLSKLRSPFALTLQGFLAGALVFFTVHPFSGNEPAPQAPAGESILATLEV